VRTSFHGVTSTGVVVGERGNAAHAQSAELLSVNAVLQYSSLVAK